jgi:hypothetical protein
MKSLLRILVTVGICYAIWNRDALLHKPATEANDPTAAMEKLAAAFPRQASDGKGNVYGLSDISYDVKKTDSLVNPIVGVIHFYNAIDHKMMFQWKSGRWVFTRLLACYQGENDITDLPGGREWLSRPEMRAFLAKCGYVSPPVTSSSTSPAPKLAPATPQPGAWSLEKAHSTLGRPTPKPLTDQQRMAEWAKRVQESR